MSPERTDMKLKLAVLTAAAALALPMAASAQGQNCGARTAVVDRLADKYGESRQSIGMAPKGRVVEVFASQETGTWTILVTMPNGVSCLMAAGKAWEGVAEAAPRDGKGV